MMTVVCTKVVAVVVLAFVVARLPFLGSCQSETCTCDTPMQREALAALYSSTGGPSWFRRDNWLSPTAGVCSWYGVSCSSINLTDNNLMGALPLMLSQLTGVAIFSVARNSGLRGTLPAGLSNWTSLNMFDVAFCSFEGTLPGEFRSWRQLTTFDINGNRLNGTLSSGYSVWSNLLFFNASTNLLKGTLPNSYRLFLKLRLIDVSRNTLSGTLSPGFNVFAELVTFAVGNNAFSGGLPVEYKAWSQITYFSVSSNFLSGTFPSEYSAWSEMQFFLADTNLFKGTLPIEYAAWGERLIRFCVTLNRLSGTLPPAYKNWTHIGSFEAAVNLLSGSLPSEYRGTIKTVFLSANTLTGTLPREYASWGTLQTLMLFQNNISGAIPAAFSSWSSIAAISLATNQLTGTLPPELGGTSSWKSLSLLALSFNKLSGTIPPSYALMPLLVILMLDNNKFVGGIPNAFAGKSLLVLSLHNNTEFGATPLTRESQVPWIGPGVVTLCNTRLCGSVPAAWASASSVCKTFVIHSVLDVFRILPEVSQSPIVVPLCAAVRRTPARTISISTGIFESEGPTFDRAHLSVLLDSTQTAALIAAGAFCGLAAFPLRRLLLFPVCGIHALTAEIDWSGAPLQVSIGSSSGAAHRGAIVGNIAVLACSAIIGVAVVMVASFMEQRRRGHHQQQQQRRRWTRLFWSTAGRLRLPGILCFVVGVLYQQTWLSAVILLAGGGSTADAAVGALGLVLSLLCDSAIFFVLVARFYARPYALGDAQSLGANRLRKGLQWLAGRRVDWQPSAEASRRKVFGAGKHFVECYGYLFRSCTGARQWWLVVDVAATSILATLAGTAAAAAPASSSCRAQQWLFVVVCGALCAAGYVLRPKQRRVALGMLWVSDGALFVMSLARAVTSDVDNAAYEAAATTISVLSLLVSVAVNVVDRLFLLGVDTTPADAYKSVPTARKGARRGSSNRQRLKRHDGLRCNALRGLDDRAPTNCSGSLLQTVVLACAATYCRLGGTNDTTAALRVLIETAACVRTRSATPQQEVCTGAFSLNLL